MKQHILPGSSLQTNGEIIPCQCLDFVEASHRHRVYPLMYCRMELTGRLDINCLKQSVFLTGKIVPEILYAYDFKRGVFFNSGYTSDDVVKYTSEPIDSMLRPDLSNHPQLQILIKPQRNRQLVIIIMSHILTDGEGFLQYLYLLSSLYNGRQPDKRLLNVRNISPLLKNIRIFASTEQTRHNSSSSVSPLRLDENGNQFFCLTSQISEDCLAAIRKKAKKYDATLNDVFMTAYARVIARLQNINTVVLPCPADLRRFRPRLNTLTVANMTGIYRKITFEIPDGCSFTTTLQQVHIEMELQKSRYRCFAGIKILNTIFRKIPLSLLEQIIKTSYRLLPVSYTNLGVINSEKLCFKGCTVQNCFFTGTYRLPPDFQLTISTFKSSCTLSCSLIGTENDSKNGQYILNQVKYEILKWIESK